MSLCAVTFRTSSGKLGTQDKWGRYPFLGGAQLNCQGAQFSSRQAVDQTSDPLSGLSSLQSVERGTLGPWSFNTGWVLNGRCVRNDIRGGSVHSASRRVTWFHRSLEAAPSDPTPDSVQPRTAACRVASHRCGVNPESHSNSPPS